MGMHAYFLVRYKRPQVNAFGKPIEPQGTEIDTAAPAIAIIPKAGSEAMVSAVSGWNQGTRVDLATARANHPVRAMFLRHPLDRFLSCFSFFWPFGIRGENPADVPFNTFYDVNRSVEDDLDTFVDFVTSNALPNNHYAEQVQVFTDGSGLVPNQIFQFDNIGKPRPSHAGKTYWETLFDGEGPLPHVNAHTRKPLTLTTAQEQKLNLFYADDLALYDSVQRAGGSLIL